MSAASLEAALRALGIDVRVEAYGALALLVPDGDTGALADVDVRRTATALLAEHGFTHLALELVEDADPAERRAALPGD